MNLTRIDLDALYIKAKSAYVERASTDSHLFREELDVSAESIETKRRYVRITFDGDDRSQYLVETRLDLFSSEGTAIGWYCLHQDETETVVDDFLVFQ